MYEYNFAVASAQSAGKWHEFAEYVDRYYLQYRTAKDERVREEHAILDGITLPFDDKFWDEFFPPNGWSCRCETIQVSKKRYEPSNPSEALARGRSATYKPNADGVNKAAIFRFNPGKEHVVFPNTHPYYKQTSNNNISGNVFFASWKESMKEMKNYAKTHLIGKKSYTNDAFEGREAVIVYNTIGEIFKFPGSAFLKFDILTDIDKYFDSTIELKPEPPYHYDNKAIQYYILETTYKGELSELKNRTIKLTFRENQNKTIDLYQIRLD